MYSLICAMGGAIILNSKNRGYVQGFFLGLFFGFIGLIITVGIAPQEAAPPRRTAAPVAAVELQPSPESMSLPATVSAVVVGVLGGIGVVAGVVAFANWM